MAGRLAHEGIRFVLAGVGAAFVLLGCSGINTRVASVPLGDVLKAGDAYHLKQIRVEGYLVRSGGQDYLFCSKEALKKGESRLSARVFYRKNVAADHDPVGRWMVVTGWFVNDPGVLGNYGGSIGNAKASEVDTRSR
jgi:hypothetical protein